MATHIKRYMPDGSVRGVLSDETVARERKVNALPVRASRVEIAEGTNMYHVDFSLVAQALNRPEFEICLRHLFETHGDAVKAEVSWLNENYVREGVEGPGKEVRWTIGHLRNGSPSCVPSSHVTSSDTTMACATTPGVS